MAAPKIILYVAKIIHTVITLTSKAADEMSTYYRQQAVWAQQTIPRSEKSLFRERKQQWDITNLKLQNTIEDADVDVDNTVVWLYRIKV
jgi:hypothetical protein